MKTKLYLLSFLFSFVLLSCREDESRQAQIRLSKVTYANSLYPDRAYVSNFSYNNEGLLKEYRELFKNGNIGNEYVHSYDGSNRILTLDLKDMFTGNYKQIFTYANTGRLSSATETSEGEAARFLHLTFQYGDNGRVVRWDYSRLDPAEVGMALILDYDNVGNIIRERSFSTSPTGELLSLSYIKKITYDDKKNPFHQLGSPWRVYYGYTHPDVSRHITFFSNNNPTRVEVSNQRGEISSSTRLDYQYNQAGYPSQLTIGYATWQMDYVIK